MPDETLEKLAKQAADAHANAEEARTVAEQADASSKEANKVANIAYRKFQEYVASRLAHYGKDA